MNNAIQMRDPASAPQLMGTLFDEDNIYSWQEIRKKFDNMVYGSLVHFYVYRHAASTSNESRLISGQRNVNLSERGKIQAAQLSKDIPKNFDIIICSRLSRTWQTMQIALDQRKIKFYTDKRINEVSLGSLEGKARRYIPQFADGNIDFAPPSGESYRKAAQRAFSFISDIHEYCQTSNRMNSTVLVFTHQGILRIISSLLMPDSCSKEIFSLDFKNTFYVSFFSRDARIPSYWL